MDVPTDAGLYLDGAGALVRHRIERELGRGEQDFWEEIAVCRRVVTSRCRRVHHLFALTDQPLFTAWRPLKVSSATPDLSNPPKPSATILSNCFFVAAARGRLNPCALARLKAMPESLAACAAEKKQPWSRFCMSSPSVCKTREFA